MPMTTTCTRRVGFSRAAGPKPGPVMPTAPLANAAAARSASAAAVSTHVGFAQLEQRQPKQLPVAVPPQKPVEQFGVVFGLVAHDVRQSRGMKVDLPVADGLRIENAPSSMAIVGSADSSRAARAEAPASLSRDLEHRARRAEATHRPAASSSVCTPCDQTQRRAPRATPTRAR